MNTSSIPQGPPEINLKNVNQLYTIIFLDNISLFLLYLENTWHGEIMSIPTSS